VMLIDTLNIDPPSDTRRPDALSAGN
jgi:hypothetical protein